MFPQDAKSKVYGMDYLTAFYDAAARAPQQMAWGAGYKGFDDTLASWTLNRVVGQKCGHFRDNTSAIRPHKPHGASGDGLGSFRGVPHDQDGFA